jgi:hypothetical protein
MPTGGVRRFFFKLELLGQRHVDQFKEFSHRHCIRDTDKTPKQPPHPAAPSATTSINNRDLPNAPSSPEPTHIHTHSTSGPTHPGKFRIALQNNDPDHPDVIIITTLELDEPPFCCHEELLSMPRSRLLVVADTLNARLPSALAISTDEARPDSWMRSEIEWVVGLRSEREREVGIGVEVPGAPRAVRTWSVSGVDDFDILREMERTPPTSPSPSPLTRKSLQMSPKSPRLERLAEEDEEEESESLVLVSKVGRAAKTRRAGGRAVKRRKVEGSKEANADTAMDVDGVTPVAVMRMQRARSYSAAASNVSPTPCRVLRSDSHSLGKKPNVETVFGGAQYTRPVPARDSDDLGGAAKPYKTVTPRKTRSLRPLGGYRAFIAPEDGEPKAASTSTSIDSSLLKLESPMSGTGIGRKRKRSLRRGEEEQDCGKVSEMRGIDMNMDVDAWC